MLCNCADVLFKQIAAAQVKTCDSSGCVCGCVRLDHISRADARATWMMIHCLGQDFGGTITIIHVTAMKFLLRRVIRVVDEPLVEHILRLE